MDLKSQMGNKNSVRRMAAFIFCGLVSLLMTTVPAFGLEIKIGTSNGEEQLWVGSSLFFSWGSAPPGALLEVRLVDEVGTVIAHRLVAADEYGVVPRTLLWNGTGVVGCDPGVVANPLAYTYHRFEEADTSLAGRTLTMEVLEGGLIAVLIPIPIEKPQLQFAFFSDENGCRRSCFSLQEQLYVTGVNFEENTWPLRFFFFGAPLLSIGQVIEEARGEYLEEPQELPSGSFTEIIANATSIGRGYFSGLLRNNSNSNDYIRLSSDQPLGLSAQYELGNSSKNPWEVQVDGCQ